MEKIGIEEPIISKDSSYTAKKKVIITIISIIGIALIVFAVIAIIIISQEEYTDPPVYTYGLELSELKYRTSEVNLTKFTLLEKGSSEYFNLNQEDKEALKYLVKAAVIMDNIHLRLDNEQNKPFLEFLEREIKKNVEKAKLTKILFQLQKGVSGRDNNNEIINLAKDYPTPPGLGVYPSDLNSTQIIDILYNMMSKNDINDTEKVKNLLSQRTLVLKRENGNELKYEDYITFFKDDFEKIADNLEKALNKSTNDDFNEYLRIQIQALRKVDPELDSQADIKWAKLQNTPLEFTLVRENYLDEMTPLIMNNESFMNLLNSKNIYPIPKDSLGIRVGIVNKERTEIMRKINELLPEFEEQMPLFELYENNSLTKEALNQTFVDADLVYMTGMIGAFRGSVIIEETLPNDDKNSIKEKRGGKRNVFHRQIINQYYSKYKNDIIKKILISEQRQFYEPEYYNLFLQGLDMGYNLGPYIENSNLGEYKNILEENKIKMISFAFIDDIKNKGIYNDIIANNIKITSFINMFPRKKPALTQYSRVASVMAINYFLENKAAKYTEEKQIQIFVDKVCSAANSMLNKIIEIQLNNDYTEAKLFVDKYFQWIDFLGLIGNIIQNSFTELAYSIENPLADELLKE